MIWSTFSDSPGVKSPEPDHDSCGVAPQRLAELAAAGWERRATTNEPRLSEAVEVYRLLGFQVHLEPFDPSAKSGNGCTACFENPATAELFKTVFTRKQKNRTGS